jgi:hypothetical protein
MPVEISAALKESVNDATSGLPSGCDPKQIFRQMQTNKVVIKNALPKATVGINHDDHSHN